MATNDRQMSGFHALRCNQFLGEVLRLVERKENPAELLMLRQDVHELLSGNMYPEIFLQKLAKVFGSYQPVVLECLNGALPSMRMAYSRQSPFLGQQAQIRNDGIDRRPILQLSEQDRQRRRIVSPYIVPKIVTSNSATTTITTNAMPTVVSIYASPTISCSAASTAVTTVVSPPPAPSPIVRNPDPLPSLPSPEIVTPKESPIPPAPEPEPEPVEVVEPSLIQRRKPFLNAVTTAKIVAFLEKRMTWVLRKSAENMRFRSVNLETMGYVKDVDVKKQVQVLNTHYRAMDARDRGLVDADKVDPKSTIAKVFCKNTRDEAVLQQEANEAALAALGARTSKWATKTSAPTTSFFRPKSRITVSDLFPVLLKDRQFFGRRLYLKLLYMPTIVPEFRK